MSVSKIALEEHWAVQSANLEKTIELTGYAPRLQKQTRDGLLDLADGRLAEMDRAGIEISVFSLTAPDIEAMPDAKAAAEAARSRNDHIVEAVAAHPDRFRAFAALPLQDAEAAATELRRCVRELGMVGTMVNGFATAPDGVGGIYLDDPRYDVFWAEVEELGVPLYLHPRQPLEASMGDYRGREWLLGAAWAFHPETGTHALRLMGAGVFDRHPGLRVILGHMGELLPFQVARIDKQLARRKPFEGLDAQRDFAYYLARNFYITISGNCDTAPFWAALLKVGENRLLYATDWPYESMVETSEWFDNLQINDATKERIGRTNAAELLKLNR